MTDATIGSGAWRNSPEKYLAARSVRGHRGILIRSEHVAVRDGTRLAVDVCLPGDAAAGEKFPVLLLFTPYYRRFKLKQPHPPDALDAPDCGQFRDFFVPRGYVVVIVDVRGSGASFGTRLVFRSPEERLDAFDVADWVVAQEWCDGKIGSIGISYVGAAADFLATTGHSAVRAVMPMFSVWDTYANHFYPGGVYMSKIMREYGRLLTALDLDDRPTVASYYFFADPHLDGPAPVDADPDGVLLATAVAEHAGNFEMADLMPQLVYRDRGLKQDVSVTSAAMSPFTNAHKIARDVAHYGVSGWMDGAGYSEGAAVRFRSLTSAAPRLMLGPWDHGMRAYASPLANGQAPAFPLLGEALRFFDFHLKGDDNGQDRESPVHYFTFIEEKWKEADTWPPKAARESSFALATDHRLIDLPETVATFTDYRVDFRCGTGSHTRHERIATIAVTSYYPDWDGRDSAMLVFRSAPMDKDTEIVGHTRVRLHMSCTEPDAAIFVYLEDEAPDGATRYVTEGKLRLANRRTAEPPSNYRTVGPFQTHIAADAAPMVPGNSELIEFSLLPISWLLRAGHRLRFAIAGADRDHYEVFPAGRHPAFRITLGGPNASVIAVPMIDRS